MENNNFGQAVSSLMEGMHGVLGTKTVVGEATQVGDTIIVPLVDVSFGVGAGSNDRDKKKSSGGGFGAKMSPSAVLIIHNGTTRLVNVKNQDAVTKMLDLVPDVIDKIQNRKSKANADVSDTEAEKIAFPDDESGDNSDGHETA